MAVQEISKREVVMSWLKNHGYYRVVESVESSITIIEADGKMRKMIVGIECEEEEVGDLQNTIIKIADNANKEAWVAKVEDQDDEILWSFLE